MVVQIILLSSLYSEGSGREEESDYHVVIRMCVPFHWLLRSDRANYATRS